MLNTSYYMSNLGWIYWIVSYYLVFVVTLGGGIGFMRSVTEQVYEVPTGQVIGSSIETRCEMRDGKPVGINKFIGM